MAKISRSIARDRGVPGLIYFPDSKQFTFSADQLYSYS